MFNSGETVAEALLDFSGIPLVSCSKDMLFNLQEKVKGASYDTLFLEDGEEPSSPDSFPCFNGSSEEVKDQIIKYYVNKYLKENTNNIPEFDMDSVVEGIIRDINYDALEIRVPTKVLVDNWKKQTVKRPN